MPWIAAAAVGSALIVVLDPRGVRLNLVDLTGERLPPLTKDAAPALKSGRAALAEVRKKVRHGELPLDAYESARRDQVELERGVP